MLGERGEGTTPYLFVDQQHERKTSPAWNSVLFSSEISSKLERSFYKSPRPINRSSSLPSTTITTPSRRSYLAEVIASRLRLVHTPDATQHHQIPHSIHWEGSFSWLPGFPIFHIFAGAMDAVRCDAHHSLTDRAGSFFACSDGTLRPRLPGRCPASLPSADSFDQANQRTTGREYPPKQAATQQCEST